MPASSPFHVSSYFVALFGKYICYAMLALSIDLIWGYCGILSLGHGAFFALGGYAMGMYLMRQIGTRGVYANPVLPDFMVFLNWPELPVYWYGFQHFPYALLMIVLVPGLLAFVFGWFAFRSRVTGVYLSIITQALTFALMLGFFRNNFGFGGNNGLTDFKDILGFNVQAPGTRAALFAISMLALDGRLPHLPHHRHLEVRQGAGRDPRRREPDALPRLSGRILQAVRVHAVGLHGRRRRRALRAAGRHHQSERVLARQLHRSGYLGRGRRPRHAHGRDPRRGHRQLRQDLLHQRSACPLLAVHAWRPVRRGDVAIAARHRRHRPALAGALRERKPDARTRRDDARRPAAANLRRGRRSERPWTDLTAGSMLYLDGVSVSFDGFKALNNLSLTVAPGEMRAIIGPNGAGKTTMMDVVTGKTRPDDGEVFFDGTQDLTALDETEIAELGIGRKFQKPTVFEMHTVEDNILLALKSDRRAARDAVLATEPTRTIAASTAFSGSCALAPLRERIAGSLSHGQKQWLEIGMLLAQEPKLLLVDEPVAGMTDAETRQTAELLKEINRDRTVIVVEHDMTFVRELGVKVTCLHEGTVIAEGSIDQVSANERVIEVYLGR